MKLNVDKKISATLCSMCIVSKTTVAIFAGLIGMALQKSFSKEEPAELKKSSEEKRSNLEKTYVPSTKYF